MNEDVECGGRAELNDAELAGASGGGAGMEAMNWCLLCDHGADCDIRNKHKLSGYIEKHGHLKSYTECPAYGKA